LVWRDGCWRSPDVSAVSYPEKGNEACYQVEDSSYWFRHRRDCILAAVGRHPPSGRIFDIGGGNGGMALALQAAGHPSALVEPGSGVERARQRGLEHVVHATLGDAGFAPHSIPAAGMFDVLEHIEDERRLLRELHGQLARGGRFYCTVPADPRLWSGADVDAGHFRRYTPATLAATLEASGFVVEFLSPFFAWLILPVGLLRALPWRLRHRPRRTSIDTVAEDHRLPRGAAGLVAAAHRWELARLREGRRIPAGTSLLCVARTPA
jgi:SAM-dependent methyltransferase